MVEARQTSASMRADYLIHQRRARETHLQGLNTHIAADYKLRHQAHWETKTEGLIAKTTAQRRFGELCDRRSEELESRRQRLAELLETEESQYKQEYIARQETPEDIRQRMAERLNYLKTQRETERKADVERRLLNRTKAAADELRLQDAQLQALHTKLDQEHQMWEKQQKEQDESENQALFDELWRRENIKRGQLEAQDMARKEQMHQARMTYLDWQKDLRQQQRTNMASREAQEKMMLTSAWEAERQAEATLLRARQQLAMERNSEIMQHNEMMLQVKASEEEGEKLRDRELVASAVAKETAEEERERLRKEALREEAKKMLGHYSQRAEEEAALDKMIEQYTQMESDKQHQKIQEKYRQEEAGRVKLMEDVYDSRANAVYHKRRLEDAEQQQELRLKETIKSEVEQAMELDQMRRTALAMARRQHQDDLTKQVSNKEKTRMRETQNELYERKAAELAEAQYKRMLAEEKRRGMQLLDELRAKRPY
jgi:hypothetical protein